MSMSALPSKADMCGAIAHVCFGPEADIATFTRSFSRRGQVVAMATRSVFAVLRLMISLILVVCMTGKSGADLTWAAGAPQCHSIDRIPTCAVRAHDQKCSRECQVLFEMDQLV